MEQNGDLYKANGIGLDTLKRFERILIKSNDLLEMCYGIDGETPVSDAELTSHLEDEMVYIRYVVVPLYNEAESLPELVAWIDRVAAEHGYTYEVILVDDGSSDDSWSVVESLKKQYPAVRGIGFARNYGKSAALYCGFAAAEGEVVVTMDVLRIGVVKSNCVSPSNQPTKV